MITNAVFQGGGVKGIALVGALKKIEEAGIKFTGVSGTSAGSIVAALYAAGYDGNEMKEILTRTPLNKLLDLGKIPYCSFIWRKGFYKGDKIYNWIYELLKDKNIEKFNDLQNIDLKILASDLTNRELLVFDRQYYGNMKIAEAVRMSISIPLFFKPYYWGEKFVVDGGVLSNYPIFSFNNPENTLGFKLVSNSKSAPKTPNSFWSYLKALIGTITEAHDKRDEISSNHQNIISIDDAGISSIKFNLTDSEKTKLFNNGSLAATKFLTEQSSLFGQDQKDSILITTPRGKTLNIQIPLDLKSTEVIRFSISGLFRIKIDGKYLLIKGKRIDQFQPVGGVFKRLEKSTGYLEELRILDDKNIPIDDTSRDDLRLRVPFDSVEPFVNWYFSEKGREISPWREFYEELVKTKFLPQEKFEYIFYEHTNTHLEGIRYTKYLNCFEILIAEIYNLQPTPEQFEILKNLKNKCNEELIWCDEDAIIRQSFEDNENNSVKISETAIWTL